MTQIKEDTLCKVSKSTFIDIDHYVEKGENPFDVMPRRWNDAQKSFRKTLSKLTEYLLGIYS